VSSAPAAEVARLGYAIITADALRQTVARSGYDIFDEASIRRGLQDAIQFELLAAEAKKLNLEHDPAIERQIKELLVQRLLNDEIDKPLAGLHFSDEQLKSYYDAHTSDFRRPALARGNVLTILIAQGKETEAHAKGALALEEWKTTHKPEAVVKKYSDDPSERISGGLTDYFIEGQQNRRYPPAVADAMLKLQLRGDVTGPISTPRALYLVGLVERQDPKLTPFDQSKPEIQKRLLRERRDKALAEYCESLKTQFPVSVNEVELKSAVQSAKPGAGPPRGPVDVP
jgi:parvulin-like peptidyl-prolyl isomerase